MKVKLEQGFVVILIIVLVIITVNTVVLYQHLVRMDDKIRLIEEEVIEQTEEINIKLESVEEQMKELERGDARLEEEMRDWLEEWQVETGEVTGYAPLDPNAIPGWDYAKCPKATASGKEVVPGWTVAAGPGVDFGDLVWFNGYGWRKVMDRGGRINNGQWDLAVDTKAEAREIGRRQVQVIRER